MRRFGFALTTSGMLAGAVLMSIVSTTAASAEDDAPSIPMPEHAVVMEADVAVTHAFGQTGAIRKRISEWKRDGKIVDEYLWQMVRVDMDPVARVYVTFDFGRSDKEKLTKDFAEIGSYLALGGKKVEISIVENSIASTREVMETISSERFKPLLASTRSGQAEIARLSLIRDQLNRTVSDQKAVLSEFGKLEQSGDPQSQ